MINHEVNRECNKIKFRVFSNVAPRSLSGVDRSFRGMNCLHHQGPHHSDDGVITHV
jgi:hypothetical protein